MRKQFGTALGRWLRGGIVLSSFEAWALDALVSKLPPHLRQTVEAQFDLYTVAQREIDGRALNFYPTRSALKKMRAGIWPLAAEKLPMSRDDAPLIRLHIQVKEPSTDVYAVLHAVNGRVFCISFNEDVRPLSKGSGFEIKDVVNAWRSNFPAN